MSDIKDAIQQGVENYFLSVRNTPINDLPFYIPENETIASRVLRKLDETGYQIVPKDPGTVTVDREALDVVLKSALCYPNHIDGILEELDEEQSQEKWQSLCEGFQKTMAAFNKIKEQMK